MHVPPGLTSQYEIRRGSLIDTDNPNLSEESISNLAAEGVFRTSTKYRCYGPDSSSAEVLNIEYYYQCYYCRQSDSLESFLAKEKSKECGHSNECWKSLKQRVADHNATVAHGVSRNEPPSQTVPQIAQAAPEKCIERPAPGNDGLPVSNVTQRPAPALAEQVKKRVNDDPEAHLAGEASGGQDYKGADNSEKPASGKNSAGHELSARQNTCNTVSALEDGKDIEERPENQKKNKKKKRKKKSAVSGANDGNKSMNTSTPGIPAATASHPSTAQAACNGQVSFRLNDIRKSMNVNVKGSTLCMREAIRFSSNFDLWDDFRAHIAVKIHMSGKYISKIRVGFGLACGPEDDSLWPFLADINLTLRIGGLTSHEDFSLDEQTAREKPECFMRQKEQIYREAFIDSDAFNWDQLKPLNTKNKGSTEQYTELTVEYSFKKK